MISVVFIKAVAITRDDPIPSQHLYKRMGYITNGFSPVDVPPMPYPPNIGPNYPYVYLTPGQWFRNLGYRIRDKFERAVDSDWIYRTKEWFKRQGRKILSLGRPCPECYY
ncbi:hypothetical protein BDV3_002990 [Batrachochytrium dendrobatidis]